MFLVAAAGQLLTEEVDFHGGVSMIQRQQRQVLVESVHLTAGIFFSIFAALGIPPTLLGTWALVREKEPFRTMTMLLILCAAQLACGGYENVEHLMMKDSSYSLKLLIPTSKGNHEGSRGINSKLCDSRRTLDSVAGNRTATGMTEVDRRSPSTSTWTLWRTSTISLVQGQDQHSGLCQGEVRGPSYDVRGCEAGASTVVQIPEECNTMLAEWHPTTPKEYERGADRNAAVMAAGWQQMALGGNHCSVLDELACLNSHHYMIDHDLNQEIEPMDDTKATYGRRFLVSYFNFVDKVFERTFIYIENYDIKLVCAEWIGFLKDGMRQIYGLMSTSRTMTSSWCALNGLGSSRMA
eukprot:s96_g34.t1